MRSFRWLLVFGLLAAVFAFDLTPAETLAVLLAAALAAWGADIANQAEAHISDWRLGRKERRERQRHSEVRGDIAAIDAKIDQLVAGLNREAETAIAREDTEGAKALRRAEYERIIEAFREIIALYDRAAEYGEMANATIRDTSKIVAGDAADANQVEVLLGLPLTGDPDYHKSTSAEQKVERIWARTHLYHKERVEKIGKDNPFGLS